MLDPENGKTICGPLEGMLAHQIAVGHMIRIVDITHVAILPFHVRFHGMAAVVTKISFCWRWVHVGQHVNLSSVL
jgi:hypothetical protein